MGVILAKGLMMGKNAMKSVHGVSPTASVYQSSAFPTHVVFPWLITGLAQNPDDSTMAAAARIAIKMTGG